MQNDQRCRRVATLETIDRTIFRAKQINSSTKKTTTTTTTMMMKKKTQRQAENSIERDGTAATEVGAERQKMQFKSEKNGMRRMVYASILKRLVFFGFVAEEDSAISQYHECIIRILLLSVMNLANRHVALCASFSTFYTTVVYGMHGKRAAIIQQKCCNTHTKKTNPERN